MQKRQEEAGMGFKLDPREIGWAPYVMIGGGLAAEAATAPGATGGAATVHWGCCVQER